MNDTIDTPSAHAQELHHTAQGAHGLTTRPPCASTLFELLRQRADPAGVDAHRVAFSFLGYGAAPACSITFADLDREARRIAVQLQSCTQPGDRVLLCYPPGIDYVTAFWACVYSGTIAVPALMPASPRTLPRLQRIVEDARPAALLTVAAVARRLFTTGRGVGSVFDGIRCLSTDDGVADSTPWRVPAPSASDTVFLQYTSGSTAAPRGVMVSHRNILANLALSHAAYGTRRDDTCVSWLPAYHDFGLIGGILYPVYVGCRCVQFDPAAFLASPYRWLKAVSDHRAQITGAPDFAYALCVEKISAAQRLTLDLSSLHVAINGAERIRPDTLRRFREAFAECGLRPDALTPSYGLAESVLFVCAARSRAGCAPQTLALEQTALEQGWAVPATPDLDADAVAEPVFVSVAVGAARSEKHEVLIVDSGPCAEQPDRQVGEIWVRGPSVAEGYWGDAEQTAATFQAVLDDGRSGFLRTGDLGFVDAGQLYITGRAKELIVLNGRNLYPQDLEMTVEHADPAFRAGGCAVFAVDDDQQEPQLVAVQEIDFRQTPQYDGLAARVLADLVEQHGVTELHALLVVKPGRLPRTSSGKIQRLLCRQWYAENRFEVEWQWPGVVCATPPPPAAPGRAPETPTEQALADLWAQVLGGAPVSMDANFFSHLGGNSLLATQIVSRLRDLFQIELPLRSIFEARDLAALAREVDRAKAAQSTSAPLAEGIAVRRRDGPLPASFAQQRLWLLDQMQPGDNFYNIPAAIRIRGPLDTVSLRRSLDEIVRRHEALRTRFAAHDGCVMQHVVEPVPVDMPCVDLGDVGDALRSARVEQIATDEAARPFDLRTDALVRAALVRLGDDEHVFLLTLHHIVADLWSMGVFMRELTRLYAAFTAGRQSPLLPLAIQYPDFAAWQRVQADAAPALGHLAYWKQRLGGDLPMLSLPTDRPRPAVPSQLGANLRFALDPDVVARLRSLGAAQGATLYMVMLAAFKVLLHRWSHQDDLVVASPIANRNRGESEGLIGFFVNTLLMRSQLGGNPTFIDLLAQVRDTALDAYARQDLSFDRLVAELQPEREATYTPLFRVMFALQNAPLADLALAGLRLENLGIRNGSTKFDLTLFLWESRDGIGGEFEYSTELFDGATIERMAGHFQTLLASIVAQPQGRLLDLPMLGLAERRTVVSDWNRTASDYPAASSIHALFEEQAALSPHAVALRQDEHQLSYAELDAQANRLAGHLVALGAAPGSLVAMCLGRSTEAVVTLLAILKAGAAYVPLDPAYPAQRLRFMLDDACATILVTRSEFATALPAHRAHTVWLDQVMTTLPAQAAPPAVRVDPDQLAYVNYTSGTTGRPKGVAVTHRGVVRLVKSTAYVDFRTDNVFLHMAALTFDATSFELWGALANGAAVFIAPGGRLSTAELAAAFRYGGVNTAFLTASLFNLLVDEDPDALAGLRHLLVGGEALSPLHLRRALAALPKCRFSNAYGPTETTTFACCFDTRALPAQAAAVPIGLPIANTECYVLDRQLNPAPIGVAGELFIGGAGLARGYLHQPGLTAERFCPHPFSDVPGARLYRTGDMVRRLPSGAIDFIGRLDHQVKIRGFRIELGEIESALVAHRAVKDAVVLARQDHPGDKVLTAYVVPRIPEAAGDADAQQLQAEQIAQWQSLYDNEVYTQPAPSERGDFNIAGWNSSYTGVAINAAEMREWLDGTVARIAALQPRRVWEIGCGTGLLLLRLAAGAESYLGTDFSAPALSHVAGQLLALGLTQVRLAQRLADDFTGVEPRQLDTVVLNSIIQYFPSLDYLLSVLQGAVEAVGDGGAVFVGDVRHFGLLRQFHTSVQLHQTADTDSLGSLREKVRRQVELENELVVAPALFHSLRLRLPRVSRVEVLHKRGTFRNELSLYRYDVILHVGPEAEPMMPADWTSWDPATDSPETLAGRLGTERPPVLALYGIPNARHWHDHLAVQRLAELPPDAPRSELQPPIGDAGTEAVDPEQLARQAEDCGYDVELRWAGAQHEHCFDAVLVRRDHQGPPVALRRDAAVAEPWSALANNPLIGRATESLLPELREWLRDRLPYYAQPMHLIMLDHLPLNANGKVDLLQLPSPTTALNAARRPYTAPRSATEMALAEIWAKLLRIERVGVNDNFFELGGHSLLASQGLSRLRERFPVELSLKQCFLNPTVEALARLVDEAGADSTPRIKRLPRRVSA